MSRISGRTGASNVERYWERKHQELRYLQQFSGKIDRFPFSTDYQGFRQAVLDLRRSIRARQQDASAHLSETAFEHEPAYEGSFGRVSYTYQRYDLSLLDVDWMSHLYHCRATNRAVGGHFFGSGMGAIGAILSVFSRRSWTKVAISPTAYFETHLLCRRFFKQIELMEAGERFPNAAEVLWLDTSSPEWPEMPERNDGLKVIVIDTSCIECSHPVVVDWLREASRLKATLILIRSHLKLDSFGLELGKLGSVVVIAPNDTKDDTDELLLELHQARTGLGLGFEIDHLYPWLGDSTFAKLSTERTEAIRSATESLADAIHDARTPDDRFEIIPTAHRIFLLVRTGLPLSNDSDTVKKSLVSRAISRACIKDHLPVFAGSSFGQDRVAILDFVNLHDDLHYLRVSGADVEATLIPAIGRHIAKNLSRFAEQLGH